MGMEYPWLQVFRGDLAVSSPVWFGVGGADGEGSLRRALAFVPPHDPLLIILDEPR